MYNSREVHTTSDNLMERSNNAIVGFLRGSIGARVVSTIIISSILKLQPTFCLSAFFDNNNQNNLFFQPTGLEIENARAGSYLGSWINIDDEKPEARSRNDSARYPLFALQRRSLTNHCTSCHRICKQPTAFSLANICGPIKL